MNELLLQTLRSSKSGKVLKDCGNLEVKDIDLIAEGTTPVGQYLSSILDIIPSSKYLTISKTLKLHCSNLASDCRAFFAGCSKCFQQVLRQMHLKCGMNER